VINLIRRKIDTLRGVEVKQRSDPKAWPRTPADADSAEIATDTLRYVFDSAKYNQQVRKWVWKDLIVVGWSGRIVPAVRSGAAVHWRQPLARPLTSLHSSRNHLSLRSWER